MPFFDEAKVIYAINYDLKSPGQDYEKLHEAIKGLGPWWHYLDSCWLVDTELRAQGIWTQISANVDQTDNVLVIRVSRDYAGWLPQAAWDWINARSGRMAT
jgi:hypothetical protein